MPLIVKQLKNHSPECVSVRDPEQVKRRGGGAYVWHLRLDQSKVEQRDAKGGLRGNTYAWLQVICADPRCDAIVLVRLDSIRSSINEALETATAKP